MNGLYTVDDVAKKFNVTKAGVYRLIQIGRIKTVFPGRPFLLNEEEINRLYIKQHGQKRYLHRRA